MIDMPCEVREDDIYVPLGYLCQEIMETAEEFLQHMQITGDFDDSSQEASLLKAGFAMGVGGIVNSLTTYGQTKDEMSRLNTVEDFLKIAKENDS